MMNLRPVDLADLTPYQMGAAYELGKALVTVSRKIEVQVIGDAKSLEAALGRAQKKTSTFGKAVNVGAKVGAAGFLALGVAAKIGFDEMNQHLKVVAQTNAVLKSTGNAANVTASHVDELSRSISNYSGQDDEAVQASENMLLTFKNIQNQAGRTNDVFDQATKATADLSQAMGIDLTAAALQVGKALNDPEKGMKRLQRIGVQFTDSQVQLVAALVKTGRTQEAQKVIIGELNQEFGGSAKMFGQTLPGQMKIAQENFRNLTGQLVSALIPALLQLTGILNRTVDWMRRNQTATQFLVVGLAALSTALIAAKVALSLYNSALFRMIKAVRIATIVEGVWTGVQWALNAAMEANPVIFITTAIIALGVAIVIAYKKSATFRNIVNRSLESVRSVVEKVVGVWKFEWGVAAHATQQVWSWVNRVISAVQQLIGWIGKIHFPSIPSSIGGVHIPGLSGGLLSGHTSVIGGGPQQGALMGLMGGRGAQGRPNPTIIHVMVDGREIAHAAANYDKTYRRQNGRSLFA